MAPSRSLLLLLVSLQALAPAPPVLPPEVACAKQRKSEANARYRDKAKVRGAAVRCAVC